MSCVYEISILQQIVFFNLVGPTTVDEVNEAFLKLRRDKEYDPSYNFLTDARRCIYVDSPQDVSRYVALLENYFTGHRIKIAILVDTPLETAIAMIFQEKVSKIRQVEVFSTKEAAVKWLTT